MTAHSRLAVILFLAPRRPLAGRRASIYRQFLAIASLQDLGMSSTWFFAAFSAALVVSAMVGPRVGRTVDAIGGREVLAASNVIFAVGLAVLGFAHSQEMLWWPG